MCKPIKPPKPNILNPLSNTRNFVSGYRTEPLKRKKMSRDLLMIVFIVNCCKIFEWFITNVID